MGHSRKIFVRDSSSLPLSLPLSRDKKLARFRCAKRPSASRRGNFMRPALRTGTDRIRRRIFYRCEDSRPLRGNAVNGKSRGKTFPSVGIE